MLAWYTASLAGPASADASEIGGAADAPSGRGVNIPALTVTVRQGTRQVFHPVAAFDDGQFARMRRMGVRWVRLVVRPALLWQTDAPARQAAQDIVATTADRINAAGLAVVVDMHPWWPDTPADEADLACTRGGFARLSVAEPALAARLAHGKGWRALELLNEPKVCPALGADWYDTGWSLYQRVRAAAPDLPLVVGPAQDDVAALHGFDPTRYRHDRNVWFSVHFYEPYVYTTPGGWHLPPQPFPPPGTTLGAMRAWGTTLLAVRQTTGMATLWRYLATREPTTGIDAAMDGIGHWADQWQVPRSRVLIGEYGVVLPGVPATERRWRAGELQWLATVSRAGDRNGLAAALWLWPWKDNYDWDRSANALRSDVAEAIGLRWHG